MPASTGYGEPIQRLFKFKDGERVVAAFSLDPRAIGDIGRASSDDDPPAADAEVPVPPVHALAVTSDGYSLRFSLGRLRRAEHARRPPLRAAGRRRRGGGRQRRSTGDETVIAVTREARAMLCPVDEVNFLAGPGKGVILHQARRPTTTACSGSSPRRATATC